jgi:DNA-binding NtrC family response regulator
MSASTQAKLLRVLQNGMIQRLGGRETIPVDVRVIAATHRDLETAIVEKQFREDLFYRLNHFVITLPPLRDRTEDIPELAKYFVQRYSSELGLPSPGAPTDDAVAYLLQQTWPGNVRELRNIIRKGLLLARGYPLTVEIIQQALSQGATPTPATRLGNGDSLSAHISDLLVRAENGELKNIQAPLAEFIERELFSQAIQRAKGDITKASGWLGISRPTLREKLIKYGLYRSHGN